MLFKLLEFWNSKIFEFWVGISEERVGDSLFHNNTDMKRSGDVSEQLMGNGTLPSKF